VWLQGSIATGAGSSVEEEHPAAPRRGRVNARAGRRSSKTFSGRITILMERGEAVVVPGSFGRDPGSF
jgi:hypothetical protein